MIRYLSVHDLVWINSTATGETLSFDYERLEQAMAAQYSYGNSSDVHAQAANLLHTLVTERPFEYGNLRTAYAATVAFAVVNGYGMQATPPRAAEIVAAVANGGLEASNAVSQLFASATEGASGGANLRSLVTQIFNAHSEAIAALRPKDE